MVLHASALRHALAALGGDGAAGEELVELLAGEGSADGLARVLSPAMLQQVLRAEGDTVLCALANGQG